MRAVELPGPGARLRLVERPVPEPGPGEVRVRVEACGVCGSDLLIQKGGLPGTAFPLVLGHEAAGLVDALGPGVEGWAPGEQVAIYYMAAADDRWSRAGRPNLSAPMVRMGVERDGAFAEHVVVPAATLIRPPARVEPAALAVLTDAVATPYHALVTVGRVASGETLVVLGVGGIGSNAIQLGRHLGARVVAATRSEARLELARDLGAHELVQLGGADDAARLRRVVGGRGAEIVVQCADAASADELAVAVAGPGGRVVLVGAAVEPFPLRATDLIWRELSLFGSRAFTPAEISACIELYLAGAVRVDHLLDAVRPLEEADDALEDLRAGRVLRSVLVP